MDLNRIHTVVQIALIASLALILSYLETMIPLPVAVPGIKLGLANVAVLIALFHLGWKEAAGVALVKVLASGLLFGSPMMLAYSACGMALAYLCMVAFRAIPGMGIVPVSMVSAIFHNIGQLIAASVMLGSWAVFATLPVLAVAACITGALVGFAAQSTIECLACESQPRPEINLDDFSILPGEHVAFIGANGSGKSTAVLQIAGLTDSYQRDGFSDAVIVFQDPDDQIVEEIVEHDVAFGLENKGIERKEMGRIVETSLEQVGQLPLRTRCIADLSGGQKQDVVVAGACAFDAQIVIFDESTAMLDPVARRRHRLLTERLLAEGKSVITVTQIPEEAFNTDRIIVFSNCEVVMQGTPNLLAQEAERLVELGISLPPALELAYKLRASGVPVSLTNDIKILEEELACLLANN